jgi:hypothetical protein
MTKYHFARSLSIALASAGILAAPARAQGETPPAPEDPPLPTTLPNAPSRSYLGIGGALGLSGSSTALSSGGVAIMNRQVLSDNLSIRNSNIIFGSRSPAATLSLTYDLPLRDESSGDIVFSPFIGGGAMLREDNGTFIDPHLTAGVDLPLPIGVTGLLHLNVGFPRDKAAEIGVSFGVGLNF